MTNYHSLKKEKIKIFVHQTLRQFFVAVAFMEATYQDKLNAVTVG